ncbi:MAG: hypothetical protein WCO56_06265 [Verrucomicrobiota bacterium]
MKLVKKQLIGLFAGGLCLGVLHVMAQENPGGKYPWDLGYADLDQLVAATHKASLKLREEILRKTIAKDSAWPPGIWGDNLWTLSALYLNEKVDVANARLVKQANDYIDLIRKHGNQPIATPEQPGNAPWTFFSVTDYVRTLCLFHAKSLHFPGRLKPETEAAMKEALWLWVSGESRITDTGLDNLFLLLGTENHDLNRRPNYYLVTVLLKEDPAYCDRKLADGHTVAEHADAHAAFLREWPRRRAQSGLWVEVGSNTYQKYSWPALFNLHELAPDPVIRRRFGLLLDLAFVEEEQISVRGRRGGGRSRAEYAPNAFESYKNLLYASEGQSAGSSHSRVIETSRYQLPPEAILLRKRAYPATAPFVIRNRVLGELETAKSGEEVGQRLAADSALVNYAYRTPHYLLGSTLQNPALTMPDPKTGTPSLKYSGISRQKRACGMFFDDPSSNDVCAVYPEIGHGGGGRPQHSFWSVQHENVLILQRIAPLGRSTLGSYNTDAVGIGFEGKALKKVEEAGWIFASNGKAFVGVKFLDGGYQWVRKQALATPANFNKPTDRSRLLLHAGDLVSHESFDKFKATVLANRLNVTPDKVDYQFGPVANHLEVTLYDAKAPDHFSLPRINGKPVDLRPAKTYQSPYLNGDFGSDKISVSVGPLHRQLDFSK